MHNYGKQHVSHLHTSSKSERMVDKESHQDYFDKVQEGSLGWKPRVDRLLSFFVYLVTVSLRNSVVPVKCLILWKLSIRPPRPTARRSTSFERRPGAVFRRTLQVKGEMQPCFQGLFFLDSLSFAVLLTGGKDVSVFTNCIKRLKVLYLRIEFASGGWTTVLKIQRGKLPILLLRLKLKLITVHN